MTGLSSCPDPEVLAAFVAGSLTGPELKMTADHLLDCEECRDIVAEAARVDREMTGVQADMQRKTVTPWWLAAAAAALAGVAYAAFWMTPMARGARELRRLVMAAPREHRFIEPRLSGGFPWAPLHSANRGNEPLDASQMKLVGAAGAVLEKTAGNSTPEARHAAALAHLIAGRPKESSELLARLAPSTNDPKVWSDLAASRYAEAVSNDDPPQLAQALAATDTALRIQPGLPEALFNRALIIERLGLREQARSAWQRFLDVDSRSDWGVEANQHLKALTPSSDFREELQRRYAELTDDAGAAQEMAHRYPQETRVWGETEILGRWAEAVSRADSAAADGHLRLARSFGDALAREHGEGMLQAAVAAIDHANEKQRSLLVNAHLLFRSAQKMYKAMQLMTAEQMFIEAGTTFEHGGSPAALLAQYFAANVAFDGGRVEESRAKLQQLASTAPAWFPAHRAQVEWELGLAHASLGKWGDAMRSLADSVATFERLGEMRYATSVRDILAEVYDRIGDSRAAWKHRVIVLRELGRSDQARLQIALDAAAHTAALNRDWPVGISLLGLELEAAKPKSDDLLLIETLLLRARMETRIGQTGAATNDVADAKRAIAALHDPAVRERADADRMAVEASIARSPQNAVQLLAKAIDFHRHRGRRMLLPDLFLQRGRTYLTLGNHDAAESDFDAGIGEMTMQRQSINGADERWSAFSTSEELFDEAIALAAARGNAVRAFTYADRARTSDDLTADSTALLRAPIDAVVIEYAALPARLVIFVVSRGQVRAIEQNVSRAALLEEVELATSSRTLSDETLFRDASARLYRRLVAPIASDLAGRRLLVFIPDAALSAVPFAALLDDRGSFIVEKHLVVTAPSASALSRLASAPPRSPHGFHLLLVAGPASRDGDPSQLIATQREAEEIAATYGETSDHALKEGDRLTFETRAADADVIHFVGHANLPDDTAGAALITSRNGAAGLLDAREIAAMHLQHTRVVVLAACGTARGQASAGKTSISVARAFLAAGAGAVVATLWPIDDRHAAEFFPRLHYHLKQGLSPAEALRVTQLEWIGRRGASPGMWAAVQVIGI